MGHVLDLTGHARMAAASLVLWFADAFHPVLPSASTTCFQSKLTQNWPRSSKEGRPILEMSWNVCHQGSRRAGSTARRLHFSTQLPDCLRDSYQVTQSSPSAPPTLAPQLPCWAHSSDGRTRMAPNARYVAINCSLTLGRAPQQGHLQEVGPLLPLSLCLNWTPVVNSRTKVAGAPVPPRYLLMLLYKLLSN